MSNHLQEFPAISGQIMSLFLPFLLPVSVISAALAKMKTRDWLLTVILSMIWGSAFMFIKIALRELTPFWLLYVRLIITVAVMICICLVMKVQVPSCWKTRLSLAFLGIINTGLPFYLISWAQQHVDSSSASILNATSPVFAMILAHFFTADEKLTFARAAGVLTGVAGIIVMVWSSLTRGIVLAGMAQGAILCATFNYAVASIYARRFKSFSTIMVTTVSLVGAIIFLSPGLLLTSPPDFSALKPLTWFAVCMLGLVCTALAYLIYFALIASAGATNALLVTLLIPVNALLLGNVVLGETLQFSNIVGMLLIFSGLLIIDGRFKNIISGIKPRCDRPA